METVLHNPVYKPLLAIVKGCRNGFVYGMKIRFPHSLVMTFLFHEGTLRDKFKFIIQATFQHARNLALISTIYKVTTMLLRRLTGSDHPIITFVAAFLGGYFVFGNNNKINMQINLYIMSRVILGLINTARKMDLIPQPKFQVFPIFAGIVWGLVLCLFENQKGTLQLSLQSSMTYIFHDSFVWSNIWDFLVYNNQLLW